MSKGQTFIYFNYVFQTGLLWRLLKAIFFLIVAIALLPLVPNLPPHFSFTSFTIPPPPVLEGKLALNDLLNGAERAFEGEIVGPEGFAVLHGDLYTTLHGGYVAKITNQQIIPVVKFGQSCGKNISLVSHRNSFSSLQRVDLRKRNVVDHLEFSPAPMINCTSVMLITVFSRTTSSLGRKQD